MDKKSRLKEELRLLEAGRDFLENVELPKHTNSLLINVDDGIKPYKKVDVIPIPDGATNGDVIKAMFPNVEVDEKSEDTVHLKNMWHNPLMFIQIPKDIWNAPYKKDCIPCEYDYLEDMELRNPQMHR